jgi:hypothetical protein
VSEHPATDYVVECFWPGVRDSDLQALDERAFTIAAELRRAGEETRYLGSLLMRADEVVLCMFAGSETAVRDVAERASIPFERILEAACSPWPKTVDP